MWMLFAGGLTVSLAGLLTALVALPPGLPRSSVLRCLAAVAIVCLTAPAPLGLAFAGGFLGSMQLGYALPLLWVAALGGCVHGLVFGRAVTRGAVLVVLVPTSMPYAVVVALTAP